MEVFKLLYWQWYCVCSSDRKQFRCDTTYDYIAVTTKDVSVSHTEGQVILVKPLAILHLDCCNSLLAGLPACAIQPLQLIQKTAVQLVFNLPKFLHTMLLLPTLHLTGGCWNPIQVTGTCLPCCELQRPILHPGHGQTIHPFHYAMRPIDWLLSHYEGAPAAARQNPDCFGSTKVDQVHHNIFLPCF